MDSFGTGADGNAPGVLPLLDNIERYILMGGSDCPGNFLVISVMATPGGAPWLCHLDDSYRLSSFMSHVALFREARMEIKGRSGNLTTPFS
jgi:hypothetical protein